MIEINLLPWREYQRFSQRRRIKWFCVFFTVFFLLLALGLYHYQKKLPTQSIALIRVPIVRKTEQITLIDIQYVGFVSQGDRQWGLIQLPNGEVREIKVGSMIDQKAARVIAINSSEVLIALSSHEIHKIKMIEENMG